jgi:hypothetical protein
MDPLADRLYIGVAMQRPTSPPPFEFFEAPRAELGDRELCIGLGSLRLQLSAIDEELEQGLLRRFASFRHSPGSDDSALQVEVLREERAYFIDPPSRAEFNPVLIACDGDRVRYLGYRIAGWFDCAGGRGQLLLARGSYEPAERAAENYIRAAVAWQAASRGGALVHAASAVWQGKGFLFYGESGAGKSTLSAANRRGRVVSDDLTLVLPDRAGRPEIVGSPFRGTYEEGEQVVGQFPLAAGFRIIQDRAAAVRQVPRVRAMAELVGNLPFVAEAFGRRSDLFDRLSRTFERVPLAHLHFCKDDSYWDAIAREGLVG